MSKVTKPFKELGKGIGNVAGGAVKVVGSAVKGDSLKKGLDRMGGGVTDSVQGFTSIPTFGQTEYVDKLTGGGWSKFQSSLEGTGDLIRGKSVSDDLKQYGSVLLQTGQAALQSGGVPTDIGGFDAGGLLNNILGGVQNKLDGLKLPTPNQNPANNAPAIQGSYGGQVAQNNYTPFIIVGGIILIGAVLLIKRRK